MINAKGQGDEKGRYFWCIKQLNWQLLESYIKLLDVETLK